MALIDYATWEDCDEETRGVLSQMRTPHGEIPAFGRMLANNPALLKAAAVQFGQVMFGGNLEPDLKQLAFVLVSQHNASAYCTATHGEILLETLGLPASTLEALAAGDDTALSQRQRAVAGFVRKAAGDPKAISGADLDALRDVGFDEADIVELVAAVAQANFANTIAETTHIAPEDESPRLAQYATAATPA